MRKKLLLFLFCILLMFTLVACQTEGNDTDADGGNESTTQANGDENEDSTSESSGEQVELEFFSQKPECVTVMDEIIADFMAENPNIKVVQTSVPDAGTVLTTRLATNEVPEILNSFPAEIRYKTMFDEGLLMDLTGQTFLENISDVMLEMAEYDSKFFALPMTLSSYGIYYRTDIFEDLGIAEPKTYDELIEASKTLKENNIDAFALPNNDVGNIAQRLERLIGVLNNNSNEEFLEIANGTKDVKDSDTITEFAQMCLDIAEYSTDDSLGLDYESAVADLVNDKAGMMISGTWMLSTMQSANPDIQIKLIPFPSPLSDEAKVPVNIDTSFSIAADLSPEKEEAALKFLEYMTRTEVAQKYYETDGNVNMVNGVVFDKDQHMYMKELMDQGDMFLTQVNFWPNGLREEMRNPAQQLFIDKDVDAFVDAFGYAIDLKYNE